MTTEQMDLLTGNSTAVAGGKFNVKFKTLVESYNIAEHLDAEQLRYVGANAVDGYKADRASRSEWEERNAKAMKLALQVAESKTFPWVNCSNVKFPLVTIAALQFLSRVSILTKGRQIVKCDVVGSDPQSVQAQRAKRIGVHMSYQLQEEDRNWIDDDEKAKFSASIVGCAFKKSFYDPLAGHNISEHVPASHFVVDYRTRHLEKCGRATHVLNLSENDIAERVAGGLFLRMTSATASSPESNLMKEAADQTAGVTPGSSTQTLLNYEVLEQHCWLDLDGDGYQEPYILWVRLDTAQVLRIVARFYDQGDVIRKHDAAVRRMKATGETLSDEGKAEYNSKAEALAKSDTNRIIRIKATQHFTKIPFIPSPDGGFYDLGLGAFLGPMNEAVNSLVNMLIDAGTMSNTAGGFLGRGVKFKGGKSSFDPFEWKPVDSVGDDLRKNIVPLPVREPSAVLFQLLGMLVTYSEKISGSTDIMSGVSPGQNTPAETSRNTIEQGMKIFSGIYARMHRAFKRELEILFDLNRLFLQTSKNYVALSSGDGALIAQQDYMQDIVRVFPAADPATVSETQRQQKAALVRAAAHESPGYNRYLAERAFLESHDIENIDALLPDPTGPNAIPVPPNPKFEIDKGYLELEKQKLQINTQTAIIDLQSKIQLNQAKIEELEAKAQKLLKEAEGADVTQAIAAINAQTGAARQHNDGMIAALHVIQKNTEHKHDVMRLHHELNQPPGGVPRGGTNETDAKP